jgi:hypothetical protein
LGWTDAEAATQAASYRAAVADERAASGLHETAFEQMVGA